MVNDLIAFLRARLDEDEQAARRAMWHEDAGTWRTEPTPYETQGAAQRWYIEDSMEDGVVSRIDPQASDAEGVARHIARHDPARVLRGVEGKRKVVNEYAEALRVLDGYRETAWEEGRREALELACKALAVAHADHPGYQESWKP